MPQTYTFPLPSGTSPEVLVEKAKNIAKERGVAFSGDAKGGAFQGLAQGSYAVEGAQITIRVDKKPAFVPWGLVESALREVFLGKGA